MNMGTYIKCHNGTSTFALSSSLSPLAGDHLAPPWRRCSFASDTLVLRLMSLAAEADGLRWGGSEGGTGGAKKSLSKRKAWMNEILQSFFLFSQRLKLVRNNE